MKRINLILVLLILLPFSGCSKRNTSTEIEAPSETVATGNTTSAEIIEDTTQNSTGNRYVLDIGLDENGDVIPYMPDFSAYSKESILKLLGESSEIITDQAVILDLLQFDELDIAEHSFDTKLINGNSYEGYFKCSDALTIKMGVSHRFTHDLTIVCYKYQDKNLPNVYFEEDQAVYISPVEPIIETK